MINRQKLIYFAVIYTSATIYVHLNAHILEVDDIFKRFFSAGVQAAISWSPFGGSPYLGERCLNETNCFILQTTFYEKKKLNTQKKKTKLPQEM